MTRTQRTPALEWVQRLRSPGPRLTRLLSVVALVIFVAMVGWGVLGWREARLEPRWALLVVAAVLGTPLAVALNAVELRAMARITSAPMARGEAVTASLYASAANALPLPGSVLVRSWSLHRAGVSARGIAGVQALAGATFVSVAAAVTGVLVAFASPVPGLVVAGAGVATLAALAARRGRDVVRLATVEAAMVVSELLRLAAVLVALGLEPTAPRVGGLVLAGVGAAAIGVFPAGLGVREALAALVSTATGLTAPLAVAVSVTDRIATSLVLAVMVGTVVAVSGLPSRPSVGVEPQ